jgi:hypothetical protein
MDRVSSPFQDILQGFQQAPQRVMRNPGEAGLAHVRALPVGGHARVGAAVVPGTSYTCREILISCAIDALSLSPIGG